MMETKLLKKIGGLGILISGLLFFFWFFNIRKISELHFGSYHAWRQADCISMTQQFYEGKSGFWNPTTHYIKDDGSALAAGEFPLLNYVVSCVYNLTGVSDQSYRLVTFSFFLIGMIFLYFLFWEYSGHASLSALMTLLIGSGSVLQYYAINFLPDVPALSIAIIGWYVCIKAQKRAGIGMYLFGLVFITIACLMKITLGILLGSMAMVLITEMFFHGQKSFNMKALCGIGGSILIVFIWYYHASKLDHQHPPFIFLTETRSYWNTYFLERPLIWNAVIYKWLPQVFLPAVWAFIMLGGGICFIVSKKVKIEQGLAAFVSFLMSLVFFLLLYRQFNLHDYLWIGLLIVPISFAILLLKAIGNSKITLIKTSFVLLTSILLVLQVFQTRFNLNERYFAFDNNWVFNQNLWALKSELRAYGIQKTDWVISIPDPSPNITLLVLDQPGFTNYKGRNNDALGISANIERGAKYLIVSDQNEYKKEYLKPYFKYFVFDYKGIAVFDLRTFKK